MFARQLKADAEELEAAAREGRQPRGLSLAAKFGVSALKGKQLFPHQLVEEVLTPKSSGRFSGDEVSAAVSLVLNAQWEAMRTGLLEQVEARKAELMRAAALLDHAEAVSEAVRGCTTAWAGRALFVAAEVLADAAVSAGASRPLGLSRLVCMADVSGSMSGTPMHVAIALGILVSEVRIPRSATTC